MKYCGFLVLVVIATLYQTRCSNSIAPELANSQTLIILGPPY